MDAPHCDLVECCWSLLLPLTKGLNSSGQRLNTNAAFWSNSLYQIIAQSLDSKASTISVPLSSILCVQPFAIGTQVCLVWKSLPLLVETCTVTWLNLAVAEMSQMCLQPGLLPGWAACVVALSAVPRALSRPLLRQACSGRAWQAVPIICKLACLIWPALKIGRTLLRTVSMYHKFSIPLGYLSVML